MGLVKTPELFRCGASYAGVADIERLLNRSEWYAGGELMRDLVGVPDEKLAAISPIRGVERIHVPVLLAHGRTTRRSTSISRFGWRGRSSERTRMSSCSCSWGTVNRARTVRADLEVSLLQDVPSRVPVGRRTRWDSVMVGALCAPSPGFVPEGERSVLSPLPPLCLHPYAAVVVPPSGLAVPDPSR